MNIAADKNPHLDDGLCKLIFLTLNKIEGGRIHPEDHKHQKQKQEDKEKGRYAFASSYAGFQRSIRLPEDADPEDIDAQYKNGILTVRLKKKESGKKKKKFVRQLKCIRN